jgi:hypothetical protein
MAKEDDTTAVVGVEVDRILGLRLLLRFRVPSFLSSGTGKFNGLRIMVNFEK